MGQVRMLLRAYAHEGHPPPAVLERLNRLLGPGEMVTVLYLVLDPVTGRMTYANAGHPPPLLVAPDGGTRFLFGCDPPLVGGSRPYQSYSGTVDALSTALLYTDGLIEGGKAPDAALRGLAGAAGEAGAKSLDALADAVVGTLADTTTRRDDVAILAFRRQPVDPMRFRITLPSVPHSLSTVRFSLRRWLEAAGVPEEAIFELVVACGEAATNVVEHAYGPEGGSFEVEAERDSDRIVIRIRDKGAWRPRRAGGGRGLELIRQLLDSVDVVRGPGGTTVLLERRLRLPTEV
jgi:anti-sigma regulatory factor (Ser/Thr protein kinase)